MEHHYSEGIWEQVPDGHVLTVDGVREALIIKDCWFLYLLFLADETQPSSHRTLDKAVRAAHIAVRGLTLKNR
jgi:hypothetical protein